MFSQMIALFGKFAVAGIIIPYIITWILYFIFARTGATDFRLPLHPRRILHVQIAFIGALLGNIALTFTYLRILFHYHIRASNVRKNIPIGGAGSPLVDVWWPADHAASDPPYAVVIFLYGGSWSSGDKHLYALLARELSRHCVVVVPNYSLYPQCGVDGMLADVDRAIEWAAASCGTWNGDPSKLYLVGHSAGAHLAMLAAMRRQTRLTAPLLADDAPPLVAPFSTDCAPPLVAPSAPAPIRGVIGLSGVYDIGAHFAFESGRGVEEISAMGRAMGGPARFDACSPRFLAATQRPINMPRTLLIHGASDVVVPPSSSECLWAALKQAGAETELQILPDGSHSEPVIALMHRSHPRHFLILSRIKDFTNDVRSRIR